MDQPLVSIAIPIYNSERFLPAALDSLLAQQHSNWEGLLWDDGSSDASAAIAAGYARRDPRFQLLGDGRNHGNPAALAATLAQARGAYVGVLDSDDLLEPCALSAMLDFMRGQPRLGMAYSQYLEIDENGGVLGAGTRFRTPYSPQHLLVEFMTFHFRLIRAEAYRQVGGYDPAVDESADYDLCLRLSEACGIGHLPQVLYRYRIHRGSMSASQRLRQVRTTFAAAERALQRRGMAATHALSLGIRARHVLRPRAGVVSAGDSEAEQCLRRSPPFDPASAAQVHDWPAQIEQRYRAFVADAQQRGLDARYDTELKIDSWHILQAPPAATTGAG